jgi:hypothetical protein
MPCPGPFFQQSLRTVANAPVSANDALGNAASAVLVGDTTGTANALLLTNGAFTVSRNITVQAGNTGTTTLGGSTDNNSSFTGNIVLGKNVTLQSTTTGANAVTFSTGVISGAD